MGDPIKDLQDLKNLFPEMENYKPEPEEKEEASVRSEFSKEELSKCAIYVSRDRKNRGGKTVTLIEGLPNNESANKQLLSDLKSKCATGGKSDHEGMIIQGDHLEKVKTFLKQVGFKQIKQKGG